MGIPQSKAKGLGRPLSRRWLGPHFYYDIIRLARKGWPTLARVIYLVTLLVSLTVMYRTQTNTVTLHRLSEVAERAHAYAYTIIVIQDLLVLALLPVYVASAIAEEKENQTLEALTLTHLTDRELVLGKFGARLVHVGAVVLAGFPLLVFMRLWGNVDISLLVYHEINTFLLLLSAGSVCIWLSASSESVFQAISRSYPWLAMLGAIEIIGAFVLPWICGTPMMLLRGRGGSEPYYLVALPQLVVFHFAFAFMALNETIRLMEHLRRQERKGLRKTTAALSLADEQTSKPSRPGRRGEVRSRIHPWAWPIRGDALFWKECLKDGTSWSLSARWLAIGLAVVIALAVLYHVLAAGSPQHGRLYLRSNAYSFTFTTYCVGLAAYALVVVFQMTLSVAGEREHGTLNFLLQVPTERRSILRAKWLGPWWRNWPILALSYLGVILGLGCGLYGPLTALLLLVLPWPSLLLLGTLALWLSVMCRRVLFANVAIVGIVGVLFIAHIAAGRQARMAFSFFLALIGEMPLTNLIDVPWLDAAAWALGEQAVFLALAALCAAWAFYRFNHRDYATS